MALPGLRNSLVPQGVHELANLVPLANFLLGRLFLALCVQPQFLFRASCIGRLTVRLRQTVVRLSELGVDLESLLKVGYRGGIISAVGVEDSQLQVGGGKLGIEIDSFFQE